MKKLYFLIFVLVVALSSLKAMDKLQVLDGRDIETGFLPQDQQGTCGCCWVPDCVNNSCVEDCIKAMNSNHGTAADRCLGRTFGFCILCGCSMLQVHALPALLIPPCKACTVCSTSFLAVACACKCCAKICCSNESARSYEN